jgi:DHA1 family tetracycline resistance protein-like MFS transporter
MMTGSGIILPVFARRFRELGAGVGALGLMSMSFALAQLVASPIMGALADRFGRRPLVLVALAAFAAVNVGFTLAASPAAVILIRGLGGSLTAGLFPASLGIIGDIVPEDKRARWIGIVMGSYGAGLIFGPVLGGLLYDGWGFVAPFAVSATLAAIAFVAAAILVPETRTLVVRTREALRQRRTAALASQTPAGKGSFWAALPRPLYVFGSLLVLDFIIGFAYAFIEPQMTFYLYEDLGWTTVQFGVMAAGYGLAMVIGQVLFGQAGDRLGRKPVIVIGISLTVAFYAGLTFLTSFPLFLLVAVTAGTGEALAATARSAFYFDITAPQHRSRVLGVKSSALALGGVVGPLLVVAVSAVTPPRGIFAISGGMLVVAAVLALAVLREPRHVPAAPEDVAWQVSRRRSLAAHAALRGIVLRAARERRTRGTA